MSESSLKQQINEAMKDAMRAKDTRKVATVRLILAAIKDRDIAARTEKNGEADDDTVILNILSKMIKQRQDSIKAYEEGGRCELAEREREEITVIEEFLPKQLSEEEISTVSHDVVTELEATGLKDIGRVMGVLKARYAGQMDFAKASAEVKAILS